MADLMYSRNQAAEYQRSQRKLKIDEAGRLSVTEQVWGPLRKLRMQEGETKCTSKCKSAFGAPNT